MPSAGWRKKAGVPVLAMVAATLRAIWPDFPMPVSTTLPFAFSISLTASSNWPSSLSTRDNTAAASSRSTCVAVSMTDIVPPICKTTTILLESRTIIYYTISNRRKGTDREPMNKGNWRETHIHSWVLTLSQFRFRIFFIFLQVPVPYPSSPRY